MNLTDFRAWLKEDALANTKTPTTLNRWINEALQTVSKCFAPFYECNNHFHAPIFSDFCQEIVLHPPMFADFCSEIVIHPPTFEDFCAEIVIIPDAIHC